MINTGLQLLNAKDLLDYNPKSYKKFRDYLVTSLQGFQGQLSKGIQEGLEIPEVDPLINREQVEAVITWTPRILLDFFDEQKVHLIIEKTKDGWYFVINQNHDGTYYKSRNEAEIAGFNKCFTELESIL